MEDGGKIKKRFGLSLKTSKKNALEFSKPDSKKAARSSDSTNAKCKTFDGYFTKPSTKQKNEKCLAGGRQYENLDENSTTELEEGKYRLSSTR